MRVVDAAVSRRRKRRLQLFRMSILERDEILQLFAFHHWATDRTLAAFHVVSPGQLDQPWGGSFATGRGLLKHILGAEWLWCQRWTGTSPRKVPALPADLDGAGFFSEWKAIRREQQACLDELSGERLAGELTYTNLAGERNTYPLSDIMVHVVNHGTYHRGQMTHFLRDQGLPAPSTDYLVFLKEQRQEP